MFIQLEHNVPEIYAEKSRDFQLLCRIISIVLNAAAERSSGIIDNIDVDTVEESLLYPLVRKLGFTSGSYFPPKVLKNIAENFPHIIRNKGTLRAIREAVYSVISAEQDVRYLELSYNSQQHELSILTSASDRYLDYVTALLEFVMPTGIVWNYVPNITVTINYQDNPKATAGIIRFKGIQKAISHIIQQASDIIGEGEELTERGVDWDELEKSYKVIWGADPDVKTTGDPPKFYSKVNVAKIIRTEQTKQSKNAIGIARKDLS